MYYCDNFINFMNFFAIGNVDLNQIEMAQAISYKCSDKLAKFLLTLCHDLIPRLRYKYMISINFDSSKFTKKIPIPVLILLV